MPFVSGALPSSSTRSVSTVTAIVVIAAEALSVEAADAAVTDEVLEVPSVAVVGGVTRTQTLNVAPAARSGVEAICVTQVGSKKVTGNVPPLEVRLKWSVLNPRFLM